MDRPTEPGEESFTAVCALAQKKKRSVLFLADEMPVTPETLKSALCDHSLIVVSALTLSQLLTYLQSLPDVLSG